MGDEGDKTNKQTKQAAACNSVNSYPQTGVGSRMLSARPLLWGFPPIIKLT